jgi:colanic acid/amylovoran biosynthesis glycosyltransferase
MEGQGVVLLEAQAYGLPVVATHHSAFPETVADDRSGFLVPERDVDALAERIIYLLEHPEIWPKMGRAGRAHVEANYDINKLNDRLVEIYQELLDGKISSNKQKVEIVSGQEQKQS